MFYAPTENQRVGCEGRWLTEDRRQSGRPAGYWVRHTSIREELWDGTLVQETTFHRDWRHRVGTIAALMRLWNLSPSRADWKVVANCERAMWQISAKYFRQGGTRRVATYKGGPDASSNSREGGKRKGLV